MAMQIAAGRAIADTLARIAAGELDASLITTLGAAANAPVTPPPPTPDAGSGTGGTGAAMTALALARADSLASAQAQRTLAEVRQRAAERAAGQGSAGNALGGARRASGDSLRGVITLEGTPPAVRVTLRTPETSMPVALSGMAVSDLLRLEGLEAVVRGVRVGPAELAVSSFNLRAIDGIPVVDGVLTNQGGAWSVRQSDGTRRAIARVPTQLQPFVGSRVWIALGAGASPSHGVITRR
jgi:hypothetical protein